MAADEHVATVRSVTTGSGWLALHSGFTFATVSLLTIVVHEFAHGLAALALGTHPVVHGTYETDVAASSHDEILIAAAGPLVNLAIGILLAVVPRRGQGSLRLTHSWAMLLNLAYFYGYLLTAPFLTSGDIGKILELLDAPPAAAVGLCVFGAVGVVSLGWTAAREFLALTDQRSDERMGQLRQIGLFGWLGGAVLTALALFPPQYASGVVAIATTGVFTMLVRPFLRYLPDRPGRLLRPSPLWLTALVFLLVVAVVRLVIDPGIAL